MPVDFKTRRRLRTVMKRRKKKDAVPNAWRLIDTEFDTLNAEFQFTVEACCDENGLNSHHNLPYCSSKNSFMDHDATGQSVFINPPWKLAKQCIEHMHHCHAKDPKNTKAVIVLPDWHTFSDCT